MHYPVLLAAVPARAAGEPQGGGEAAGAGGQGGGAHLRGQVLHPPLLRAVRRLHLRHPRLPPRLRQPRGQAQGDHQVPALPSEISEK